MWCHCLLASMVSEKKPTIIGIVFLQRERHHFSVTVFRIFPLSLVYQHFIITTLGLYCSELAQTLESTGLYLLTSLGSFQPVFLQEFFRTPPFPFSSSVVFLSQSHRSLWLCSFIVLFSLFCSNWIISTVLCSSSFRPLCSVVSHPLSFCFSYCCFQF